MLERALEFLGLEPSFQEVDLKERFYFLSKKYHPDTGEFSNDSLFKELIEYRDVLQSYLIQKTFKKSNVSSGPKILTKTIIIFINMPEKSTIPQFMNIIKLPRVILFF